MNKHVFYLLFLLPFLGMGQEWVQALKLTASDRAAVDLFGYSVDIDGDYAIVGAYNKRAAYIFKNENGSWVEKQKITPSDGLASFGYSVAMSGDYVIVGTLSYRDTYIFKRTEDETWTQQQKITTSDPTGPSGYTAVDIYNGYAVIGVRQENNDAEGNNTASQSGAAYIYKQEGETWIEQQKIVASDRAAGDVFGSQVSLSENYIVVTATGEDEDANGGNTRSGAGSAYIFKLEGNSWVQQQKIVASDRSGNDMFGYSVSIDGNYIVVGADKGTYGAAYIFNLNEGVWSEQQKLAAPQPVWWGYFANSVKISGDYIIAGHPGDQYDAEGGNAVEGAGSAHIFKKENNTWVYQQKIVPSTRNYGDYFGNAVAMSGDYFVTGAPYDAVDANGENTMASAGSAYVFKLCTLTAPEVEAAETCAGQTAELNASVEEWQMVKWYSSADATEPVFTGAEFITPELTQTTSYWAEVTENVCISGRTEVIVTVNPIPELGVVVTSIEACEGTYEILTATSEGNTIHWYDSAEAGEPVFTGTSFQTPALTETTSYWVEAVNESGCISARTEILITVIPAPEFTIVTPEAFACYGNSTVLEVSSPGNIIYWYSSADAEEYITYGNFFTTPELTEAASYWVAAFNIFTGCFSEREEITVTVNPVPEAPQAVTVQYFEEGETLADLEVEYTGELTWYADEELTIVLPPTTLLVLGTTYYATQTIDGCESISIAITVEPLMGIDDSNGLNFSYYPNPVKDVLVLKDINKIESIIIYDVSGKKVKSVHTNEAEVTVDFRSLPAGTYLVQITSASDTKVIKIIKK